MKFFSVFRENRFLFLLISMLLLMLMQPMLDTAGLHFPRLILKVFVSLVFLSAIYAVSRRRRTLLIGALLLFPSFGMQWVAYFVSGRVVAIATGLLFLVFFTTIAVGIVRHVLEFDKVTFEQVSGTLCVYLLLGLVWAEAYQLVDTVFDAQFSRQAMTFGDFVYFSFVTLTTLGYGNLTPASEIGQQLAVFEALIGQVFLVTIVGLAVGNLGAAMPRRRSQGADGAGGTAGS
jgi:voltage-gated potassium channel Kch